MTGKVLSINLSEKRGTNKYPVDEGVFKIDVGLVGDGHSGNWHRQVSLFSVQSLEQLSESERKACELTFSENITIDGLILHEKPIGTKVEIGDVLLEITQIGKPFEKSPTLHTQREIIMHQEGVFLKVLKNGIIKPNDHVIVI